MVRGDAEDVVELYQNPGKLGVPLNVISVLNPLPLGTLVPRGIMEYVNYALQIWTWLRLYGMSLDQIMHTLERRYT